MEHKHVIGGCWRRRNWSPVSLCPLLIREKIIQTSENFAQLAPRASGPSARNAAHAHHPAEQSQLLAHNLSPRATNPRPTQPVSTQDHHIPLYKAATPNETICITRQLRNKRRHAREQHDKAQASLTAKMLPP